MASSWSRSSIRSSPSSTANGSSPTCCGGQQHRVPEALAGRPAVRSGSSPVAGLAAPGRDGRRRPSPRSACSSSMLRSKWSSSGRLLRPVIIRTSASPARTASSTTYWIAGLSTTGSISLGIAFVAGRNRVPRPAAGMTAFRGGRPASYRANLSVDSWPLPAHAITQRSRPYVLGAVQSSVGFLQQLHVSRPCSGYTARRSRR